jgi:hypothetical protein
MGAERRLRKVRGNEAVAVDDVDLVPSQRHAPVKERALPLFELCGAWLKSFTAAQPTNALAIISKRKMSTGRALPFKVTGWIRFNSPFFCLR